MANNSEWDAAQVWESQWWKSCINTYNEETKQLVYAEKMGLKRSPDDKTPYRFDMEGKKILDIGGGPISLLLKCVNVKGKIIDPIKFPDWVYARYETAGIEYEIKKGEDIDEQGNDECWLYNVLEHTEDPKLIVDNARRACKIIRIFEWLDTPIVPGHIHTLTEEKLNEWLDGDGRAEQLNDRGCRGRAYYGVFPSDSRLAKAGRSVLTKKEYIPQTIRGKAMDKITDKKHLTFHVIGLSHLPCKKEYMGCAFSQKILNLIKMLKSLGHTVYFYGAEGSETSADEFIQTHTLKDIRKEWGSGDNRYEIGYNWREGQFKHDLNKKRTDTTLKYYANCIKEINARKKDDDFLLLPQGVYQKPIADKVGLYLTCEPGIGYRGSYCPFRAFESSYIQNFTYGSEHPRQSINGAYYDRVIPNYFDPKDFVFSDEKEDYYLYMGRMIIRKGIWTAVKATEAIGAKLILAGQEDPEVPVKSLPSHCEFVGYADIPKRKELMSKAIATFTPTTYLEPFCGSHIESMLHGTPPITTNFAVFPETIPNILNGKIGFRCDTLQDFVDAAEKAKNVNHKEIREYGERFLMDNVKWQFEKWFNDLMNVYESTQDPRKKGWHRIEQSQ